MALQRSTTRATPLERPFRFIFIFTGDAQAHRQLLCGYHEGVNPSSHWPALEQKPSRLGVSIAVRFAS